MKKLLFAVAMAIPLTVAAQIYKTTDEDGNIVFTDRPAASGSTTEKVELNPTNTAPPPPEVSRPEPEVVEEEPEQESYTVVIDSPTNETTIPVMMACTAATEASSGRFSPILLATRAVVPTLSPIATA